MTEKNQKKKKWEQFEYHSHKVIKELYPASQVFPNVKIEGKLTKVLRQVDIQMVEPQQYEYIAFECKDHRHPIDVPLVEAFVTKLEDIGAKKGAIVANINFTEGSKNLAAAKGLDLLNLVDTSNRNIRARLYATLLLADTSVKRFSTRLLGLSTSEVKLPLNPTQLTFVDSKGSTATAYEIFSSLWNNESLAKEPGLYEYLPPYTERKVRGLSGAILPVHEVAFRYEVVKRFYVGKIEMIETKGLYNVKEGSFMTRRMITQPIIPHKLERQWKEISSEEAEKERRNCTFGLEVNSIMAKKPRKGYSLGNEWS